MLETFWDVSNWEEERGGKHRLFSIVDTKIELCQHACHWFYT